MKIHLGKKAAPPAKATAVVHTVVKNPDKHETPIEQEEHIQPEPVQMAAEMGEIDLKLGVTIGLPNYSGVRVDVGIAYPIDLSEDVDEVYGQLKEWVVKRLQAEAEELVAGLTG